MKLRDGGDQQVNGLWAAMLTSLGQQFLNAYGPGRCLFSQAKHPNAGKLASQPPVGGAARRRVEDLEGNRLGESELVRVEQG